MPFFNRILPKTKELLTKPLSKDCKECINYINGKCKFFTFFGEGLIDAKKARSFPELCGKNGKYFIQK